MENTITFPPEKEFKLSQSYPYKELKNIELIAFNRSNQYFAIVTSQDSIYIYDNYTKLNLGKLNFVEILQKSSIYADDEKTLKSLSEREKQRLIDSISFSKNEDYITIGSARLSTLFLLKTNMTSLITEEDLEPQIIAYIYFGQTTSKDHSLNVSMDPCSKYNCLISSQYTILSNFKVPEEFKIENQPQEDMEIEDQKENNNNNVLSEYLNVHCTKTMKIFVVCDQENLNIHKAYFVKESAGYKDQELLISIKNPATPKITKIQVNYKNDLLAIYYQRKLIRIFSLDFEKKNVLGNNEFEANEGRTFLDATFNVFSTPQREFEDWLILCKKQILSLLTPNPLIVEKNSLCNAITWYNPNTKYIKQEVIEPNLRIKKIFANFLWRSSLMSVTEAGSLVNLEFKIPNSWVRFSYKFAFVNDNEEYVEKEDEFDRKEEEQIKTTHVQLNKALFDSLPEQSFQAQQSSAFLQHQKLFSFKLKTKDDVDDEEEEEEERKVIENDVESSDSKNEIQEEESSSTPKALEEEEENTDKFVIEPEGEGEGEFNEDSNQASII